VAGTVGAHRSIPPWLHEPVNSSESKLDLASMQ